jgi:hypothetical protein
MLHFLCKMTKKRHPTSVNACTSSGDQKEVRSDNLTLDPAVFSHSWLWIATFGALLAPLVIRVVATSSAAYMCFFAGKITH